jgi:hypothetical protein
VTGEPTAVAYPLGLEDEFPNGPPVAVLTHRGVRLELRFAPGDVRGEGHVQEMRILPDTDELTPRALRQFAPDAELYLQFARSAMRFFGPDDDPQTRHRKLADSARALRELGGPGRGLSDEFYLRIAQTYRALREEGEPHPIKTIGERHHGTISAASRWVKEARKRHPNEFEESNA